MKRITLLSDTHGYLDDRMLQHLAEGDEIWHAGDIGNLETLKRLESIKPVRAVFGNIDGQDLRKVIPEILRFECCGVDVLLKHIGGYPKHYDPTILPQLKENSPKVFIAGHSHILKVIFDKDLNLLHINPGAAGISGFHQVRTMVRFTLDESNIKDLEILELGNRR